jgi:hypothetical protein
MLWEGAEGACSFVLVKVILIGVFSVKLRRPLSLGAIAPESPEITE